MTVEEAEAAFTKPEHRQTLRDACELSGIRHSTGHLFAFSVKDAMDVPFVGVREIGWKPKARATAKLPFLFPHYASNGMAEEAPPAMRQRFDDWIAERARVGFMFGAVCSALEYFDRYQTPTNVAGFLLPCLASVYTRAGAFSEKNKFKTRAAALSKTTRAGTMPTLPPEVRKLWNEAGNFFNALSLIDDGGQASTNVEVYPKGTALAIEVSVNRFSVAGIDTADGQRIILEAM